jgi:hypothetical protein
MKVSPGRPQIADEAWSTLQPAIGASRLIFELRNDGEGRAVERRSNSSQIFCTVLYSYRRRNKAAYRLDSGTETPGTHSLGIPPQAADNE